VVEARLFGRESGLDRVGNSETALSMIEKASSGMRRAAASLESSKPSLILPESMLGWPRISGSDDSSTGKDIDEAKKSSKSVLKAVNVHSEAESTGERRLGKISG
jgi:hypothetical protein